MPRSLADIDRDIGKASSQMRGALADLARLDHERRDHIEAGDIIPVEPQRPDPGNSADAFPTPSLWPFRRPRWYLNR